MQLLEITKIQILKVIHNEWIQENKWESVVGDHKGTNFESNSQRLAYKRYLGRVVGSHKDTNFESNSQL